MNIGNMSLGECTLCSSVGVFVGVKLLGHRVCIRAALAETAKSFFKIVVPIYTATDSDSMSVPVVPHPCLYMLFFFPMYFYFSYSDECDNITLYF